MKGMYVWTQYAFPGLTLAVLFECSLRKEGVGFA